MFKLDDKTRKMICIPAYLICALCALLCGIQCFQKPEHTMWFHFGIENKTARQTINIVLILAGLVTLSCAVGWMTR